MTVGDGLVRPKISYELRDNLEIHGGIDIFYGDKIHRLFLDNNCICG